MKASPILAIALVAAVCFFQAQGARNDCQIRGFAKMKSFSNVHARVKFPCKFQFTHIICDGYEINVTPGQQIDSKGRYYVDTTWVSIKKVGTDFFWRGRTSTKLAHRYFNGTADSPFSTKSENLVGAPFKVDMNGFARDYKVSVKPNDAPFSINFYAYLFRDDRQMRLNGVEVLCANPTYLRQSEFPESICGNGDDKSAIRDRRKELGIASRSKTIIYDLLSSNVVQTQPKCEIAVQVFKQCEQDRRRVVQECSVLIHNNNIVKCLKRDNMDPMRAFVYCLKYKCKDDSNHCFLLKEALAGCPRASLAPKKCDPPVV